jgi:hypothetical protein
MYVEVADIMEDAICRGHYLADVVRALVRDNPQIETERADGNVLQEIVDGLNECCAKEFQFMKTWPR